MVTFFVEKGRINFTFRLISNQNMNWPKNRCLTTPAIAKQFAKANFVEYNIGKIDTC